MYLKLFSLDMLLLDYRFQFGFTTTICTISDICTLLGASRSQLTVRSLSGPKPTAFEAQLNWDVLFWKRPSLWRDENDVQSFT